MQLQPKVSIITVNYNQAEVTCDMLDSLRSVTWPNLEIFVVDNASTKDASYIAEKYPEVIYLRSELNLGFAGGNKIAADKATGDYVLLLNNDTIVTPGFLEPMMETFHNHSKAGIVSPKIVFYYSDDLVQYAGTSEINTRTCRGETYGYMQKNNPSFDKEERTYLSHGACMLISRKLIDSIGFLDPSYFMYYEEYDYCERAKAAGFEIYYNGYSTILHKQSVSVGVNSPLKSYYITRNRIYFARKNFKGMDRVISMLYTYLIAVPKNFLVELLHRRWLNAKAILRGAVWNITH